MSPQPDENGIYTTMVTCPDTAAAAGAADYDFIHHDQAVSSQGHAPTFHNTPSDTNAGPSENPANNNANNHVVVTVRPSVVFTADSYFDHRTSSSESVVQIVNGGAKTVIVEEGAVLNFRRTPEFWCTTQSYCTPALRAARPSATPQFDPAWYPTRGDGLNNIGAIIVTTGGTGNHATVRHNGIIELDVDIRGTFDGWQSSGDAIWMRVFDVTNTAGVREKIDATVELGPKAVIRQAEGADGMTGIYASQTTEEGDIRIDLAAGSLIDVSTSGGNGIFAEIFRWTGYTQGPQTGDITINAAGTIRTAVAQRPTISVAHGTGITAIHRSDGTIRIASSGTIETWQANAIIANSDGDANRHRDDPATAEIEGHIIDVTDGKVHTRGGTAIIAGTGSPDAAFTVRVAEDALVRAELDAGPDAITQEQLKAARNRNPVRPIIGVYGWREIDTNGDGTNNALEPIVSAIVVSGSGTASEGVVDRVIVDGTVETVGGKTNVDPAIRMLRGGRVVVGKTGSVNADSGLAIASGSAPPNDPPMGYEALESDLDVTVAGRVEGDIKVLDDGNLSASVMGTVKGDILALGDGDLTARVTGTVDGNIEGLGGGDHTVDVPRGGTVTGTVRLAGSTVTVGGTVGRITLDDGGTVMVTPTGQVNGVSAGRHGVRVGPGGTIENRGTIAGTTGIQAAAGSTVVNAGTVRSTGGARGIAMNFQEPGENTLTLRRGMTVIGKIQGLGTEDTVNLSDLAADEVGVLTFVDKNERPVPLDILDIRGPRPGGVGRFIPVGNTMLGLDTTAFALTDDVLSDLTGSIHAAVLGTGLPAHAQDGVPAQGRVWAAPFGGWREQTGNGGLADGTHTFGGGLVGAGWGTPALSVGGFIGGSAGQLAVAGSRQNVDMQTVVGGAYAQQTLEDVRLDARVLVGHVAHDATRRVNPGTAHATYTAFLFSPEVGVALRMPVTTTLHAMPRLRVRYAGLFTEGFRERAPVSNWDVGFAARSTHILEGRGEVSLPIALKAGGQVAPRLGLEGRWLVAGEMVKGTLPGGSFQVSAGGDPAVATGTLGLGLTLPVAAGTTLVGNFDGALTTEHAWRATGYLGLTYSF